MLSEDPQIDAFLSQNGVGSPQDSETSTAVLDQAENKEKYGSLGQQALTFAEGLGQGAIGPLAPFAEKGLTELGVEGLTPEDQRARVEQFPITSTVGNITGFATSAALGTGLGGAATKIGLGAAKGAETIGVGSKIAQAGIRTGSEMAALESANELSKLVNDDPHQSLGSAAINIGLSGIIGGAGGAALGAVSPLWQATVGDKADVFLKSLKNKVDGVGVPVDTTFKTFIDNAEKEGITIAPEIKARLSQDPAAVNLFQTLRESGSSTGEALVDTIEQTKTAAKDQINKIISGGQEGITAFDAGEQAKSSILSKAEELNQAVKSKYDAIGDATQIALPDEARLKFYNDIIEQGQNFGANGSPQQQLFKIYGERALSQDTIGQLDKLTTEINGELNKSWIGGDLETYKALAQIKDSIRDFQDQQIGKAVADIAKPPVQNNPIGTFENSLPQLTPEHQSIANEVISQRQQARKAYADFMGQLGEMAGLGKAGKIKNYPQFEEKIQSIPSAKFAERLFDKKNIEGLNTLKTKYPDVFDTIVKQQKTNLLESASKTGEINQNTILNKINGLPKEVKSLMFSDQELEAINSASQTIRELNVRINPSGTAGTLSKLWEKVPMGAGALIAMMSGHGLIGGAIAGEAIKYLGKTAPNAAKLAVLKSMGGKPIESGAVKSMVDYFSHIESGQSKMTKAVKNLVRGSGEVLSANMVPDIQDRMRLKKSLRAMKNSNLSSLGGQ